MTDETERDDLTILIPEEMLTITRHYADAEKGKALAIKRQQVEISTMSSRDKGGTLLALFTGMFIGYLMLDLPFWYVVPAAILIAPVLVVPTYVVVRLFIWMALLEWQGLKRMKSEQTTVDDKLNTLSYAIVRLTQAFNLQAIGWKATDFGSEVGFLDHKVDEGVKINRAERRLMIVQILHFTKLLVDYRDAKNAAPVDLPGLEETIELLRNVVLQLSANIEVDPGEADLLPREEILIDSAHNALKRLGAMAQKKQQ